MRLILDNFTLIEYDPNRSEQKHIVDRLKQEPAVNKYLGDLQYLALRIAQRKEENKYNLLFLAYYDENPIGFISLTYLEESYQISSALFKEYRGQNLGSLLLQEFSEKIFEEYPIDKLILKINNENIAGQKAAELGGYDKEDSTTYTMNRR